jgi:hypothetical protein
MKGSVASLRRMFIVPSPSYPFAQEQLFQSASGRNFLGRHFDFPPHILLHRSTVASLCFCSHLFANQAIEQASGHKGQLTPVLQSRPRLIVP